MENINTLLRTLKRFECRDLSFGDTEVYVEDANGNEIGSGYFSGKDSSISFTIGDKNYSFEGQLADSVRREIPIAGVSRNDNGGNW